MFYLRGFFLPSIAQSWAVPFQSHIRMGNEVFGQGTWEEEKPHKRSCAVKPTTTQPEQGAGHGHLPAGISLPGSKFPVLNCVPISKHLGAVSSSPARPLCNLIDPIL